MSNKTDHQQRVEQMMNKIRDIGQLPPLPSIPSVPSSRMILAQAKLILEETLEVLEAAGCTLTIREAALTSEGMESLRKGDFVLSRADTAVINLPELAKELADLSVVSTGLFSELGIADKEILEATDNNNLDKFGPGGYLDENRKWRKPPNHPKPDIHTLLVKQGWVPENADENNKELSVSS